jgi:hypothetical protein
MFAVILSDKLVSTFSLIYLCKSESQKSFAQFTDAVNFKWSRLFVRGAELLDAKHNKVASYSTIYHMTTQRLFASRLRTKWHIDIKILDNIMRNFDSFFNIGPVDPPIVRYQNHVVIVSLLRNLARLFSNPNYSA